MSGRVVLVAVGLAAALAGCASLPAPSGCAPGETHRLAAQLVFGRNIGDRLGVSEEDFTRFVDEVISPRFPDGLTVLDSQGRWLSHGRVVKEPGKLVMLLLSGPEDRRKVAEIVHAYETRFQQEAVLTVTHSSCVAFWPADA